MCIRLPRYVSPATCFSHWDPAITFTSVEVNVGGVLRRLNFTLVDFKVGRVLPTIQFPQHVIQTRIKHTDHTISPACDPNTYQTMYGRTLDSKCLHLQRQHERVLMAKIIVSDLLFCASITDADIVRLKSHHTLFDKYLTTCW